ncbi:hypothetical protein BEWA_001650 [Theileria equi strain WA]|uniref:Uncharacterized protein n=1 Tax=Theileria equi strain WA TaxID=1537102 RepID=L0AZS2_THEEQ|nr:hypothetical protein BEWA_001650 [Theileria equi strain WA]AFZ80758.1 hypothetical protein BEWA_001650 [Theileria equi strain WA]|eukprot:XP_004830424.1 hypothetical protein BEWA_001650 [Theileria equi strain WA]
MEDGSVYYYANPGGKDERWCVGKLPSSHKVEDIGKILKEIGDPDGSSQIRDGAVFQRTTSSSGTVRLYLRTLPTMPVSPDKVVIMRNTP